MKSIIKFDVVMYKITFDVRLCGFTGITVLTYVSWLDLMFGKSNTIHISFSNEASSDDVFAEKKDL